MTESTGAPLPAPNSDYVDITPGVSILGVLGHLNYEPWFALAEYVDNAIQSAAKSAARIAMVDPSYKLRVDISYEKEDGGRITILDNAGGIARRDFPRAFRAAEVPPDRSGLSEFGMGMKSASIWFANNWLVTTSGIGEPSAFSVGFDMQEVLSQKSKTVEITTEPADVQTHFTRIELWNLNQFLPPRTMGKVRDHLREIYRVFLRDGRLTLTVAGLDLNYVEPRVLEALDYRSGKDNAVPTETLVWKKPIEFSLTGDVQVTGWAGIRAEGKTSGNGLSLFRRGRVIIGTTESPYRPASIFGQSNSYRSQRLFGELHLDGIPVSHTKDGFQWLGREEEFETKLREQVDAEPLPLLRQAENFRAREASRVERRRVRDATERAAEAARVAFPQALAEVASVGRSVASNPQPVAPEDRLGPNDITRSVSFHHGNAHWKITISAGAKDGDSRWLIRHSEFEAGSNTHHVRLHLNLSHQFVRMFAIGSAGAIEATMRIAVALAVSEAISRAAGDAEAAASFLRQVDGLLASTFSESFEEEL